MRQLQRPTAYTVTHAPVAECSHPGPHPIETCPFATPRARLCTCPVVDGRRLPVIGCPAGWHDE